MNVISTTAKQRYDKNEEPNYLENLYWHVVNDFDAVKTYFEEKQIEYGKCYDYRAGRQWTDAEIAAHRDQRREHYVFNEIEVKVNMLEGIEATTRMDNKAVPREPSDKQAADMMTHVLKWISQINQFDYVKSTIFQRGIVGNMGAVLVRWAVENLPYGYVKIEPVPSNEIYYDTNAVLITLEDARWVGRKHYMATEELEAAFPFRKPSNGKRRYRYRRSGDNVLTYAQRRASRTVSSQYPDDDVSEVQEHYERVKVYEYLVIDKVEGDEKIYRFEEKEEAVVFFEAMVKEYTDAGINIIDDEDYESALQFLTTVRDKIYQTIIVDDEIWQHGFINVPAPPYVIYFAIHEDGDYRSYVNSLISPQRFINRNLSQLDYQIGSGMKNLTTVIEPQLATGWNAERLRREMAKTSVVVPVKSQTALETRPNPVINPEYFQMIQFSINRLNDYAGGRNVLGLQENAAESGKAVEKRAELGSMARYAMFDNLKLWQKLVMTQVVWYIQHYMTEGQVVRVIGDANEDINYVKLTEQILGTLREIEYDVEVEESVKTDTMREKYFIQLVQYFQHTQTPPELSSPILIEYMDIPKSAKEKILSMSEIWQRYQQERNQQMKQQKMATEVQESVFKKQLKDQITKKDELAKTEDEISRKEKDLDTRKKSLEQDKKKLTEQQASLQQGLMGQQVL